MRWVLTVLLLLTIVGTAKAAIVDTGYELQKAIYSATPGETIYLKAGYYAPPTGYYYFDVNRSVTIKAYGDGAVIIDATGKTGGFKITASDVTIDGLGMMTIQGGSSYEVRLEGDLSNVVIQDLKINCAGEAYYGIYDGARNISGLTIKNVEIVDPYADGIYLYDGNVNFYTKNVVIDSVTVTDAGRYGIYACTGGTNSKNISITNSKITDCSDSGIYLVSVKGNTSIDRTIVTGNPTGIYVSGEFIIFISNYIAENDVGAKIYTSEFVAQGNAIKNNAHYGLCIYGSGTAEIYNSEFDNNGNGAYTDGAAICLTGGRLAEVHNCNLLMSNNHTIYNSQSVDVNAQYNYWGTTDTDLINDSIYDSQDVTSYGTVYYDPILTSPAQIVPPPIPELATLLLVLAGIIALSRHKWR